MLALFGWLTVPAGLSPLARIPLPLTASRYALLSPGTMCLSPLARIPLPLTVAPNGVVTFTYHVSQSAGADSTSSDHQS